MVAFAGGGIPGELSVVAERYNLPAGHLSDCKGTASRTSGDSTTSGSASLSSSTAEKADTAAGRPEEEDVLGNAVSSL